MPELVMKLRRSVLYIPASNERALHKASSLDCDCIIFDLEDSAAPQSKDASRESLFCFLSESPELSAEIVVRINALDSKWGPDDFAAAIHSTCDAVLLPKIRTPTEVMSAVSQMDRSNAPDTMKLWAMVETPQAVLDSRILAQLGADPGNRLDCLVIGSNDLALETGVRGDSQRQWMVPWLMQVILAARSGGLNVLDSVYSNHLDHDGFAMECHQAREMGFDGKTLIHPNQIAATNRIFSPTTEEITAAREVVAAFASKENAGKGVLSLNGRMVERLHLVQAQRLLSQANENGQETVK